MMSRLCVGVAALVFSVSASFGADITVGFVTSLSGPGASIGIPYEKGVLAGARLRRQGRRREHQADPAGRRFRSVGGDAQRAQARRGGKGRRADGHVGRAGHHRDGGGRRRDEDADDLADAVEPAAQGPTASG